MKNSIQRPLYENIDLKKLDENDEGELPELHYIELNSEVLYNSFEKVPSKQYSENNEDIRIFQEELKES
jgi:hypothetical protein